MDKTINLFLEFDNTQFDGNLHDILANYLNKYKDNQIPDLTKKQLQSELIGENEVTELSKKAIQEAIKNHTRNSILNERDHTGDFFDGNRLNEIVGNFQKLGINVIVLTASPHKAIRALYDMHHLDHLKNLEIKSVPANYSPEMRANSKINIISKLEGEASHNGSDKIVNFLVDSSKSSIDAFTKNRNPDSNIGMHTPKGLHGTLLNNLKKQVLSNIKYQKNKNRKTFSESLSEYFIKKLNLPLPKDAFTENMESGTSKKESGLSNTDNFNKGKNKESLEKIDAILKKDKNSKIENVNLKKESALCDTHTFYRGTNKEILGKIRLILKKDNSSKLESVNIRGGSGLIYTYNFDQGKNKESLKKINGILKKDKSSKVQSVNIRKESPLKISESDRIKNESKESYTYTFSGSTNSHVLEKVHFVLRNDQDSTIENFKIKNKSGFDVVERGFAGTNETMLADIALRLKKDNSRITSVTIEGKSGMFHPNSIEKDMINEILRKNELKLAKENKNASIVSSQKKDNKNTTHIPQKNDLSAMTQPVNKEQQKTRQSSATTTCKTSQKVPKIVRPRK
ncbi:hypothetical protein [Flavobacterium poyangense]|uniref:hypothetical protein n=1 Tax=Flavobacterium poyangense TaxID=2204302 RepID=UPI00142102AA|nr:hypothetical protein [Flavobacterium sp. JXAS1]